MRSAADIEEVGWPEPAAAAARTESTRSCWPSSRHCSCSFIGAPLPGVMNAAAAPAAGGTLVPSCPWSVHAKRLDQRNGPGGKSARARSKAFLQRGDDVVQRVLDRGAQETERNDDGDRDHTEDDGVLGHGLTGLVAGIGEKLVDWTHLPEGIEGEKPCAFGFGVPHGPPDRPSEGFTTPKWGGTYASSSASAGATARIESSVIGSSTRIASSAPASARPRRCAARVSASPASGSTSARGLARSAVCESTVTSTQALRATSLGSRPALCAAASIRAFSSANPATEFR